MPGTTASSATLALASKYQDISSKHNDSLDSIEELHEVALQEVIPAVMQELDLSNDAQTMKSMCAFVDDRATLFRFFRRSRYSIKGAVALLTSTLTWRLRTDIDALSLSSLHPLYVSPPARPPLFWCNTSCKDRLGRPAGVISLASLERVVKDDGTSGLDECREYIVGCMESVRRYLSALYSEATSKARLIDPSKPRDESAPLQMVIIFSLKSSGMANLELDLLPFLLDLLKNHFPGMVGAVYIVHYGWVHAGMWGIAKRILPQQALAKILFPNQSELADHFDLANLPASLGGEWDVTLNDKTNDVLRRYARTGLQGVSYTTRPGCAAEEPGERESNSAPPSPRAISGTSSPAFGRNSRALSRSGSYDSLVDDFYSTENTPRHLTPRPSQPGTPHVEMSSYPLGTSQGGTGSSSTLHMTPTAAKKLHQLQMTRGTSNGRRSRAVSDANRHLLTEEHVPAIRSPALSRGSSPSRTRRRTVAATLGSRAVHFQGAGFDGGEALSRKGSLRDFRLLQGQFALSELAGDESSGSEASDKSGKAGEIKENVQQQQGGGKPGGFFARWRRYSPGQDADREEANTVVASSQAEAGAEKDSLVEMDPDPLPSPKLQVPDIEEPPLSGFVSLSEASDLLSRRTRQFNALPGHVSPYNASNPFYGYPAYPVASGHEAARRTSVFSPAHHGRDQQRLQFRKRKRDLLRTLMYLFVLRLLSMHRGVRNQALAAYRAFVRAIRVGGESEGEEEEQEEWREANLRYKKLKSATLRHDDGSYRSWDQVERERMAAQQRLRARQAQPLVRLGFRKRYAFFLLFLFVIARREWRSRLFTNLKGVLALTGLGKLGAEGAGGEGLDADNGEAHALPLDEGAATTSLTGLHLRKRLGWH